tara:strand:- start:1747 stop:2766 length:1020 start_codon:yes stop_codon:yes gene_type:complete
MERENNIITKTSIKIKKLKNNEKIKEKDYEIPNFSEYNSFNNKNYPVSFLKIICKNYKLKLSGNKPDLHNRIYDFLFKSNTCLLIQKVIRGYLLRKDHKLRGKAFYNRSLCMNSTDFFTLENISDIKNNSFFSIETKDAVWGFDIVSIYNLFSKSTDNNVLNPYTREKLSYSIFSDLSKLVRLSKSLNNPVNIILNKDSDNLSIKKRIELKCLDMFQYMDELGNYTDSRWFTTLDRVHLIRFIKELRDIWEYRAQLNLTVKKEICHPYGNPFRYIDLSNLYNLGFIQLQKSILGVVEQFIKKGVDRDACNLGTSYILCGLTLVNNDAALAMPWLYQSVS